MDQSSLEVLVLNSSAEREEVRQMNNRVGEIYWPAEDSPAIASYNSECNSTTTRYYGTEIQHQHLQEGCLYF